MKNTVLFIVGPTAVGKTEYAIETALACNGEIVSADSMQLYKYMDIGSAKPTLEERAIVPHYLVDEIDPGTPFSAAQYQKLAKSYISMIFDKGKVPIVSGGTGLYVNSLIYEMDFSARPAEKGFREQLELEAKTLGTLHLHEKLRLADPEAAARIHPNNIKKIIRAIEITHVSGDGAKSFEKSFQPVKDYDVVMIGLTRDREELYRRINERTDLLFAMGLVDEVRRLLSDGLLKTDIAMQGIGYKEIIDHLNGSCTLDEAIETVKRSSRNYAKRQLTWFRRFDAIEWFNLSEYSGRQEAMKEVLEWIAMKSDIITNRTSRTTL